MRRVSNGLIHTTNYSYAFREKVQKLAKKARAKSGLKDLDGIGVFLFGSPARQEMVEESDADVMIIREMDDEKYFAFRREFIRLLGKEDFEKIDVPDWGNYEDCECYLAHSITEGNQVMESKFVYGDPGVKEHIERLKEKYCAEERFEKVFCFQKLYFDQYYRQRTRQGVKNVKYGHGGTRDLMFLTWFANLLDASEGKRINAEDNFPLAYKSLNSLYEAGFVGFEDYMRYSKSIDVVIRLRNEILIQNKETPERGLTYLDENALGLLVKRGVFREVSPMDEAQLKDYLEGHLSNIAELKDKLWGLFIRRLGLSRGADWADRFYKFLSGKIAKDELSSVDDSDELSKMAVVWNVSKEKHANLFNQIFDEYSDCDSWVVLASLCCNKDCPSEILDKIAAKVIGNKGFEYVLKIIGRNSNTHKKTLKRIVGSGFIEERFKQPAQVAYKHGVMKANELR
jgi:predicted nucleotidyltransferase